MMKLFSQLSTDISIHALLAESDRCCPCAIIATAISIHALLAESDLLPFAMTITALDFYPRSPCGERPKRYLPCCTSRIFLSTLSLRRATSDCRTWTYERLISIHALLAESDTPAGKVRPWASHISIHALLAESDATKPSDYLDPSEFLSTLSLRRATKRAVRGTMRAIISIHALLAESDCAQSLTKSARKAFLSTLSLRRATRRPSALECTRWYFYPRSPCGERPAT